MASKDKKSERKPLSFSTTMRNPERIASFLSCMEGFANKNLTSDVIMEIVKKVIANKLYKPTYIKTDPELENIYCVEEEFTEYQLSNIVSNSKQEHKEKGFEKGWESRFDTWFKFPKELGFIYYEKDKPIRISQSGYMLCSAYKDSQNDLSGQKIQEVFLNALIKYQTNNPFRKNANKNAPVMLLLNVLNLFNKEENSNGISKKEIPFVLCWQDDDYKKLYRYIKKFREEYGYTVSLEIVYEKCMELLESDNEKRFKFAQITKEGVDDFVRKIRITGLFSLRGMGRFIDINKFEIEKVNYIIENYTDYKTFDNDLEYFRYMGEMDSNIISLENKKIDNIMEIRLKALQNFAKTYSKTEINHELSLLERNGSSKDEYLKYIDTPTRLEFLTSIALVQNFVDIDVRPNYSIDDEGNPTFTARGGIGDIEVYDRTSDTLVEVTLLKNRSQSTLEIPAITRHLKELRDSSKKEKCFSIFIAPSIHEDTVYMCEFTKSRYDLDIFPQKITEFIEFSNKYNKLIDLYR